MLAPPKVGHNDSSVRRGGSSLFCDSPSSSSKSAIFRKALLTHTVDSTSWARYIRIWTAGDHHWGTQPLPLAVNDKTDILAVA